MGIALNSSDSGEQRTHKCRLLLLALMRLIQDGKADLHMPHRITRSSCVQWKVMQGFPKCSCTHMKRWAVRGSDNVHQALGGVRQLFRCSILWKACQDDAQLWFQVDQVWLLGDSLQGICHGARGCP